MPQDQSPSLLDYERLVTDYTTTLGTKLRGHGAALDYLELWVPDEDVVKSLIAMADAALAAGRRSLAVWLRPGLLSEADGKRLAEQAATTGRLALRPRDGGWEVMFEELRAAAVEAAAAPAPALNKERLGVVDRSRPAYALHPAFAAVASGLAAGFKHEGEAVIPAGARVATAADGPASLTLAVHGDGQTVVAARHQGATTPELRAVLEIMCRESEGRPLVDAAEHTVVRAIAALVAAAGGKRPLPGIMLAANAGTAVVAGHALVRQAAEQLLPADQGINFFETPPSPAWQALDAAGRLAACGTAIGRILSDLELAEGSIEPIAIERDLLGHDVRLLVRFGAAVEAVRQPPLIRTLERRLKAEVEPKLQLYLEPRRDNNQQRRL